MSRPPKPVAELFWAKVDRCGPQECWPWLAAHTDDGYGRFAFGPRAARHKVGAHRFAYELLVGPIPEGLQLDHLCHNRRCCNVAHLEPVDGKTNVNRGRHANAEKTHCPAGHPYNQGNTGRRTSGRRWCKTCDQARSRASHQRRKLAKAVAR
jgi:hypothetical protein